MKKILLSIVYLSVSLLVMGQQVTSFPWAEYFTNATELPANWDNSEVVNTGSSFAVSNYGWNITEDGYDGSGVAFNGYYLAETFATLKTPEIVLPQGAPMSLRFRFKNAFNCGSLGVYVSTDSGATYLQNPLDTVLRSLVWSECEVSLAAYAGMTVNIVFVSRACTDLAGYSQETQKVYYTKHYIDDIEIDALPICQTPKNLYLSGVTDTSAMVSWVLGNDGVAPASYELKVVSDMGVVAVNNQALVAPNNYVMIGGLQPNTGYTISIRSDCSAQSKGLSRYATYHFYTNCSAQSLPYLNNFDNEFGLPSCTRSSMTSICSDANNAYGTAGKSLQISATSDVDQAYFITPLFDEQADSLEISFKIKRADANKICLYKVGIIDDISDVSTFYPVYEDGFAYGADWKDVRFNTLATQYPVRPIAVCVFVESGTGAVAYVDDLSVRKVPTCVRPEGVVADDITNSSVRLSWNETEADNYVVKLKSETDSVVMNVASQPVTVSGLTANTNYVVSVYGDCGSGDLSDPSAEIIVKTLCASESQVRFTEGFESMRIPSCWSQQWLEVNEDNASVEPFKISAALHHSGNSSLSNISQPAGTVSFVSTNGIPFDATGRYDVSFWIYREANTANQVRIWVSDVANDTANATLLGSLSTNYTLNPTEMSTGWYNYQYPIVAVGTKYLVIEVVSDGEHNIYIDDFAVVNSPSCRKPGNVAVALNGNNGCVISWTKGENESQWNVRYQIERDNNVVVSADTMIYGNPTVNVSGLSQSTHYTVNGSVVAMCSQNDTSERLHFYAEIETPCSTVVAMPYSESFEANYFPPTCWDSQALSGADNWTVSSQKVHGGSHSAYVRGFDNGSVSVLSSGSVNLSSSNEYEVQFWMYRSQNADPFGQEAVKVYLSASANDTVNGVKLGEVNQYFKYDPEEDSEGWYKYTFPVPAATSGNKNLVFVYTSGGNSVYIDDVVLRLKPACAEIVRGCKVDNITSNSVDVLISDSTVSSWQVSICEYGTAPANGRISTYGSMGAAISGLAEETDYLVYVRRDCGNGVYSDWSEGVAFKTACHAGSVPFSEDFELYSAGRLAGCMVAEDFYDVKVGVGENSATASYNCTEGGMKGVTAVMNDGGGNYVPSYANGPLGLYAFLHLEEGKNYEISANVRKHRNAGYGYEFGFGYGVSANVQRLTQVGQARNVTNIDWSREREYFTVPADGDYYVGFYARPVMSSNYYLYVDDIMVREVQCVPVGAMFVSSVTSNGAEISFTAGGGSQWEVAVSDQPIVVAEGVNGNVFHSANVVSPLVNVSGLAANTEYYYTIRSVCGDGNVSAWAEPQSFRTRCGSVVLPYSEGFESDASLGCWSQFGNGTAGKDRSVSHRGQLSYKVDNMTVVSPEINAGSLIGYMVDGWVYALEDSAAVTVGVMLNPNDVSTFEMLSTVNVPFARRWYHFVAYLNKLDSADFVDVANAKYVAISSGGTTVSIDDINIGLADGCAQPNELEVLSSTVNSVEVDWLQNGTENMWAIRLTPTAEGRLMDTVVTQKPVVIGGLEPSSSYLIEVAAVCGAGDTSEFAVLGVVKTLCGTVSAPYSENFDNMTAGAVAPCWDNSMSTTAGIVNTPELVWGVYQFQGNKMLRFDNYQVPAGDAVIEMPAITLGAGKNWKLRFDYSHRSASKNLIVKIKEYNKSRYTQLASFKPRNSQSSVDPGNFDKGEISLANYAGKTVVIQFSSTGNHQTGAVFLDNVAVVEAGGCEDIQSLEVTSLMDTEAYVAISDTMGHSQWEYVFGEMGFNYQRAQVTLTSSNLLHLTGLTPGITYELYVRAYCDSATQSNWSHISFKTAVGAADIPYVCDFSDEEDNSLWQISSFENSVNVFTIGDDAQAVVSGDKSLYVSNDGSQYSYDFEATSATAAYRTINFEPGRYVIEYTWNCTGGVPQSDYARIYLVPLKDGVDIPTPGMLVKSDFPSDIIPFDNNSGIYMSDGWHEYSAVVDMTNRAGFYNLVFLWVNNDEYGMQTPLAIDNVYIHEYGCGKIDGISGNSTANSLSINVTGEFETLEWAVNNVNSPANPLQSGTSTTADFDVNGLEHSTTYYVFVRNRCSDGKVSMWKSEEISTICQSVTNYPFTEDFARNAFPPLCWNMVSTSKGIDFEGNQSEGVWSQFTTNASDLYSNTNGAVHYSGNRGSSGILVTPAMSLDSLREYHLSFWMYRSTRPYYIDNLTVYASQSNTSTDGAIVLGDFTTYDSEVSVDGAILINLDMPAGLSGDWHVIFEGHNISHNFLYIDDYEFDQYPECRAPKKAPTVLSTTMTTATVETELNGKAGVEYAYAEYVPGETTIADTIGSVITTNGVATIQGLTPQKTYAIYARMICGEDNVSDWSAMARATTKADDCFAPEGVRLVGQAGTDNATVTWGAVPYAATYEYYLTSENDTVHGYWNNDTITLSGLDAKSQYMFRVRSNCQDGDSTGWSIMTFETLASFANVPYSTGFEESTDNAGWQYSISQVPNNFMIGGATEGKKTGMNGLYISSNHSSYSQTLVPVTENQVLYNVSYAYRTVYIPAGLYEVEYDWRCDAFNPGRWTDPYSAYGMAFISPVSEKLVADNSSYANIAPNGGYSIFNGKMKEQQNWKHHRTAINIDKSGYYNVAFEWVAMIGSSATNADMGSFPLAIDNLEIYEIGCNVVNHLKVEDVTSTGASVVVNKNNLCGLEYGVATVENTDSISQIFSKADNGLMSDTVVVNGLTSKTHYYVYVRQVCSEGEESPWRMTEFQTLANEARVPYICEFNDLAENANWMYVQDGQENYFMIGGDVSSGVVNSLYITNDGVTNNYTTTISSVSYAYRTLYLDTAYYSYSYDWHSIGASTTDGTAYDYGRVLILPSDVELSNGVLIPNLTYSRTPGNGITLSEKALFNEGSWTTESGLFEIKKPGRYNFVVLWRNLDQYGGVNPPLAVDKIEIKEVTCKPVTMRLLSVDETSARIQVLNKNTGVDVICVVNNKDSYDRVLMSDTISGDTLLLENLSPSTTYYVYARCMCSDNDSSVWSRLMIRTACGEVTQLPYFENFENVSGVGDWLEDICWSALNVGANDYGRDYYPYYRVGGGAVYQHGGNQSMYLVGGADQYIYMVLPDFGALQDLNLSFWYRMDNGVGRSPSMSVGYMTDATDMHTFVPMADYLPNTAVAKVNQDYNLEGEGLRMAIRYGNGSDDYSLMSVDDVRVSRVFRKDAVRDTLCSGEPYFNNGFMTLATALHEGDNTLTRMVYSDDDYLMDTMYVSEVYVRPVDNVNVFDTVCSGQPYVKDGWNIQYPQTNRYVQSYTSQFGCDSTVSLYLHVLDASVTIVDTVCFGESYNFHGKVLSQPGMYVDSALNNLGCMVVDTLYLMMLSDSVFMSDRICESNLPYVWHGRNLTASGVYYEQITGQRGCQQTDVLDLTVIPTDTFITASFCQGGYYLFIDTMISNAGVYSVQRINALGCNETYHLTLTMDPAVTVDVTDYACEGQPYYGNGIRGLVVGNDTVIAVSSKTSELCDSVTNVHLSVVAAVYGDEYATIMKGEVYEWNDNSYNVTGDYPVTLISEETGCDSIVTLHLTVIDGLEDVSEFACELIPNPVRTDEEIRIVADSEIEFVEVFDSYGKLVKRVDGDVRRLRIDSAGLYFVRVTAVDGVRTMKVRVDW